MSHQKAIEKVQKLLALTRSSNVNEAQNAAKMAQEIMIKHNITQVMLAEEKSVLSIPSTEIQDFLHEQGVPLDQFDGDVPLWKEWLRGIIGEANGCRSYKLRKGNTVLIGLVGRPEDAATVFHLYPFLVSEIERLADAKCIGRPVEWRNSFIMGAVGGLKKMFEEARKNAEKAMMEEARNKNQIVLIQNALAKVAQRGYDAEKFLEQKVGPRPPSEKPKNLDLNVFQMGIEAAQKIDIKNQKKMGAGEPARLKGKEQNEDHQD